MFSTLVDCPSLYMYLTLFSDNVKEKGWRPVLIHVLVKVKDMFMVTRRLIKSNYLVKMDKVNSTILTNLRFVGVTKKKSRHNEIYRFCVKKSGIYFKYKTGTKLDFHSVKSLQYFFFQYYYYYYSYYYYYYYTRETYRKWV